MNGTLHSDMAALNNGTVTEGHALYCAANGHATHTVNGAVQPLCARCGATLAGASDGPASLVVAYVVTLATRVGEIVVDINGTLGPDAAGRRAWMTIVAMRSYGDIDAVRVTRVRTLVEHTACLAVVEARVSSDGDSAVNGLYQESATREVCAAVLAACTMSELRYLADMAYVSTATENPRKASLVKALLEDRYPV